MWILSQFMHNFRISLDYMLIYIYLNYRFLKEQWLAVYDPYKVICYTLSISVFYAIYIRYVVITSITPISGHELIRTSYVGNNKDLKIHTTIYDQWPIEIYRNTLPWKVIKFMYVTLWFCSFFFFLFNMNINKFACRCIGTMKYSQDATILCTIIYD